MEEIRTTILCTHPLQYISIMTHFYAISERQAVSGREISVIVGVSLCLMSIAMFIIYNFINELRPLGTGTQSILALACVCLILIGNLCTIAVLIYNAFIVRSGRVVVLTTAITLYFCPIASGMVAIILGTEPAVSDIIMAASFSLGSLLFFACISTFPKLSKISKFIILTGFTSLTASLLFLWMSELFPSLVFFSCSLLLLFPGYAMKRRDHMWNDIEKVYYNSNHV